MMHPVCGHEYMLMGMALDPDWVKDMVNTYSPLTIELLEILVRGRRRIRMGSGFMRIWDTSSIPSCRRACTGRSSCPGHKLDGAVGQKSKGLPVIMHSCGFVEPLLPGMIEAGIDCLQVIEVKAGMDLLKLYQNYGDRLSFMGGIDVRVLYNNDKREIDAELEAKIPEVKGKYGYVLHSDHSIPSNVTHDTYQYFIDKGLELGSYSN